MKDDEDKGSPSRGGANPGGFRREKIDRSAEALRVYHHPFNLSLRKYNPVKKHRLSNHVDKDSGNGN